MGVRSDHQTQIVLVLRRLHHPVNEDSGGNHCLRVDTARLVDQGHFGDANASRHGHHWVPIPLGAPVDQITKGVGFFGPQQGEISPKGAFENEILDPEPSDLLAFQEAVARGGG